MSFHCGANRGECSGFRIQTFLAASGDIVLAASGVALQAAAGAQLSFIEVRAMPAHLEAHRTMI